MALTRATKAKRLASLDAQIAKASETYEAHKKRVIAADEREKALKADRDWLAAAPVSDPLPEAEGGAE
jgi:hypothetical protein